MPGANCFFPECGASRTKNYQGVRIFQIPMRKNKFYTKWNNVVRMLDKDLKTRTLEGNIYVCERHFKKEDIEFTSKFSRQKTFSVLLCTENYATVYF